TEDQKVRDFQLARRRTPQGIRGFRKSVQKEIVYGRNIRKRVVRIQPSGFLSRLNAFFVLARALRSPARQNGIGEPIARIRLRPRFEVLQLSGKVSRDLTVIKKKEPAPFPVTDSIPKLVGFAGVVHGKIGLAHIPVRDGQITKGHGELRVDRDCALKVWDAGSSTV